jgi:hypothetical protein
MKRARLAALVGCGLGVTQILDVPATTLAVEGSPANDSPSAAVGALMPTDVPAITDGRNAPPDVGPGFMPRRRGDVGPFPMPSVKPLEPGPVPMPSVKPLEPGPVPMPEVKPLEPGPVPMLKVEPRRGPAPMPKPMAPWTPAPPSLEVSAIPPSTPVK